MALPSATATLVSNLNTAITAVGTLTSATPGQLTTLAVQAQQLALNVDAQLYAYGYPLDTFTSDGVAADMATGVLSVLTDAQTELSLADLRGYMGRLAVNLLNG